MNTKAPLVFLLAIATVIVSALGSWCWCSDRDVCHETAEQFQNKGIISNQKRFSNSKTSIEKNNRAQVSSKDDCCTNCFASADEASLSNFDNPFYSLRLVFCLVASTLYCGRETGSASIGRPHFVASRFASAGTGWDICLAKRSFLI